MLFREEGFDEKAVEAVFLKLQQHHDALRMVCREENGDILQMNLGVEHSPAFQVFDYRGRPDAVSALETEAGHIQGSFDLENGPLMKTALFHLDDGDRLLVVIHHLVVDGVSWRILLEDIETLYLQYEKGEELVLHLKTDSFKLWSEKLAEYANSELFLKEKSYWLHLESQEIEPIKRDFEVEDNYVKDTETLSFQLDEKETEHLITKVNWAFGTEINDILLTALGLAIKKVFGNEKIVIDLEGHGREEIFTDIDIKRTVGWFTSAYPVVLDFSYESAGEKLSRQIMEVKESIHRVLGKGIGYGILKYLTAEENKKDMDFGLKSQVGFNYLGQFDEDLDQTVFRLADESVGDVRGMNQERDYELEIVGIIVDKKLQMSITFNNNQYRTESIENLIRDNKEELQRIISHCESMKDKVLTPSALTYKELSIEALQRLTESYPVEDIYTLTPMQEGMMFHTLFDKTSSVYFEQVSFRLPVALDMELVEESVAVLFKRHDVLRTTFVHEGLQRPLQVVLKERERDFYYRDIRDIHAETGSDKKAFIAQYKEKDRRRPFDLSSDVLLRAAVLRVDDEEYEFIWSFHHILMDGWCLTMLVSEFFEIYSSFVQNRPYQLPKVQPYRIYIQWLEAQDMAISRDYWREYLKGYEESAGVPAAGVLDGAGKEYKNKNVKCIISAEKCDKLNKLALRNKATLNTVMQAAWGMIVGKYNCKGDVVFGSIVSGRPPEIPGVETIIGLFINVIPVRVRYGDKTTFRDLLQQLQAEAVQCKPHHYYSLAEIQAHHPLKQNMLNHIYGFENYPVSGLANSEPGDEDALKKAIPSELYGVEAFEQTNYDFNVRIVPEENRLTVELDYNGGVYHREFVQRIAGHYNRVLDLVLNDDRQCIEELTILSQEEKQEILFDFNKTQAPYPEDKTVHRIFEEHAAQAPDSIALVGQRLMPGLPSVLTYRELNEQAHRLARKLTSHGVGSGSIAALMIARSIDMVVASMAVLKAGGAYLPVDPTYPRERITFMIEDSGAGVVLTQADFEKKAGSAVRVIDITDPSLYAEAGSEPSESVESVDSEARVHDPAYVIYTSGSTGRPKGVVVPHQGLANLTAFHKDKFNIRETDRIIQFASSSFDASVWETYMALHNRAALYVVDEKTILNYRAFEDYLNTNKITVATLPPEYAVHLDLERIETLRLLITAGSAPPLEMVERWRKVLDYVNAYGPTETTVCATYNPVPKSGSLERVTIGKPINNTSIYITDQDVNILPVGIPGELCVGGAGIAAGYLNRPELTAERFVELKEKGDLYKTGDLARWLPDGSIEFLGRIDQQVKIRGFRIELGEIENHLLKYEGIKTAVVAAGETDGEKHLCAYIVSDKSFDIPELKGYLSRSMPDYMVPSYFKQVETIPLTPAGKVDYKALAAAATSLAAGVEYVAPENEMEKTIAAVWQEVLGLEKVGVNDNFFDIGGNSIKAISLNSKLNHVLEREISIAALFEHVTISSFVRYLDREESEAVEVIDRVEMVDRGRQSRARRKARRKGNE
jgi:amino acid adenylation domain-containing protein/non-ribosomal peptide synthase protein (TIGR01720 family)